MHEGLEFGVVKVLHIKATDGCEVVVHVHRDMTMQPVRAMQVNRHAVRLWIVVEVETDSAGGACAYVHNMVQALRQVRSHWGCGSKCGGAGSTVMSGACTGAVAELVQVLM